MTVSYTHLDVYKRQLQSLQVLQVKGETFGFSRCVPLMSSAVHICVMSIMQVPMATVTTSGVGFSSATNGVVERPTT